MPQETTISNADLLILARDAGLPITWWEKEPDREWRELRAFAGLVEAKLNETQREPTTKLPDFDELPDDAVDNACESGGIYRVDFMRAWESLRIYGVILPVQT